MRDKFFAAIMAVALSLGTLPALAEEEAVCLECHEPAEDWEGFTTEEILVEVRNPDNKRHKDMQELSDEQLQALFVALMEE